MRFIVVSRKGYTYFHGILFLLSVFLDFRKKGILFSSFMNKSYNILLNLC